MEAVELAAYYSLMPNRKGYCGQTDFASVFRGYLEGSKDAGDLKNAIRKFAGHYNYLEAIAKANNREPFDMRVVEAFWIGNGLLDKVPRECVKQLILGPLCREAGMNTKRAVRAAKNLPRGVLLHHSFNSLYLHFSGNKVKRVLANYDKCRVGWGDIVSVGKKTAIVRYFPIVKKNDRFIIDAPIRKRFLREAGGIIPAPNIRKGDVVSTHWGLIVQQLGAKELKALEKYTKLNLSVINRAGKGS